MVQVKMLDLDVAGVVKRFYAMMAGAIFFGWFGMIIPAVAYTCVLAISCILAVSVKFNFKKSTETKKTSVLTMDVPMMQKTA